MDSKYFINRELSWLSFNARVLDQAGDKALPVMDRLKFIAIFSSNLDEFFMVRVAGLRHQYYAAPASRDPAGFTPEQQLGKIKRRVASLLRRQYRYFNMEILPAMEGERIRILKPGEMSHNELHKLAAIFEKEVLPAVTPVAVDTSHPFPIFNNGAIEIAVSLRPTDTENARVVRAFVEVPAVLPRFIPLKSGRYRKSHCYVLLEDVIMANLDRLFGGCEIVDAFPFRITRDMDFTIDEEDAADLLQHIEEKLLERRRRKPIRLELPRGCRGALARWLIRKLNLNVAQKYYIPGPLNLADFFELVISESSPELVEPQWPPAQNPAFDPNKKIFDTIKDKSVVSNFLPFETFDPVVRFIEEAAEDPDVLAIKQTLYRVSGDSPVVRALQNAAENGKQVTVIVELKARFDEGKNIVWAKRLEESGAHVIYGIAGLKVHSKMLLVIRKEKGVIKRYLHLSTGNYNDKTARLYTDVGIMSDDPDLCTDAADLFNLMTGYTARAPEWRKMAVAPFDLKERFAMLIDREARLSIPHRPGRIIAKMNSLVDPEIIEHLYSAAKAGVKIDLIVRGICCLKPGIGTRNIRIRSIVDRYLEHSRIFYFENAGEEEIYLSSADWMPRNLHRRIEALFPVEDSAMREDLKNILELQLKDRYKARRLLPSGRYTPPPSNKFISTRSQKTTYDFLVDKNRAPRDFSKLDLDIKKSPDPDVVC